MAREVVPEGGSIMVREAALEWEDAGPCGCKSAVGDMAMAGDRVVIGSEK